MTFAAVYEITTLMGVGGMGEVYRATDTKLGREVAIKTLPSELANDRDCLARFEREAKLLATLNHAHRGGLRVARACGHGVSLPHRTRGYA